MSNINKITALVKAISVKIKGYTKGNFVVKNLSFEEKGKRFEVKNLEVCWDYQGTDFSYSDSELSFTGNPSVQILIEGFSIISPEDKGKFGVEYMVLNSMEEVEMFKLLLPEGLFE